MQLPDLFILSLALFQVAYSIAYLDLPFGVMRRIRERTTIGGLLTCIYCLSPWVGVALYVAYQHPVGRDVVNVLAIAGGGVMWFRYTGGAHV